MRILRKSEYPTNGVPHARMSSILHYITTRTSRREDTCPGLRIGPSRAEGFQARQNHPLIIRTRRPPGRPSVPHSQQRLSASNQQRRPCCNEQFRPANGAVSRPHSAWGHSGGKKKRRKKESMQDLGRGCGNWDERSDIPYRAWELCASHRTSSPSTSRHHDSLCSLPRA